MASSFCDLALKAGACASSDRWDDGPDRRDGGKMTCDAGLPWVRIRRGCALPQTAPRLGRGAFGCIWEAVRFCFL